MVIVEASCVVVLLIREAVKNEAQSLLYSVRLVPFALLAVASTTK